jgi:hypothetical protein
MSEWIRKVWAKLPPVVVLVTWANRRPVWGYALAYEPVNMCGAYYAWVPVAYVWRVYRRVWEWYIRVTNQRGKLDRMLEEAYESGRADGVESGRKLAGREYEARITQLEEDSRRIVRVFVNHD